MGRLIASMDKDKNGDIQVKVRAKCNGEELNALIMILMDLTKGDTVVHKALQKGMDNGGS